MGGREGGQESSRRRKERQAAHHLKIPPATRNRLANKCLAQSKKFRNEMKEFGTVKENTNYLYKLCISLF
nr:hypothetical protein [Tanacetum cinerariifolium]